MRSSRSVLCSIFPQSGCPDDEPYRVVLMAIRRRLYKTRMRMEQQYMEGGVHVEDPDVYSSSSEVNCTDGSLDPSEIRSSPSNRAH